MCKSQCPAQQTNSVGAGESGGSSNTSTSNDPNNTLECDKVNLTGLGGGVVTCWKEGIRGGQEAKACQVKGTTCQSLRDEAVEYMKYKQSAAGEQGFPGAQGGETELPSSGISDAQLDELLNNAFNETLGLPPGTPVTPSSNSIPSDFGFDADAAMRQFTNDITNPNSDLSRMINDASNELNSPLDFSVRPEDFAALDAARGIVSPDWLNRASANIANQSLGALNPATPYYTPRGEISSFGQARPDLYAPSVEGGNIIGNALVNAQEAAANAWQAVKDYTAAAWEKTMAALAPPDETLPGAGLPDSPNLTPEQELPGIDVIQTPDAAPTGLPQNVAELAEQLDSPAIAEQVRNNYVNEITQAIKTREWTPSVDQLQKAAEIVEEAPDNRSGFVKFADDLGLRLSERARTLGTIRDAIDAQTNARALADLAVQRSTLGASGTMIPTPPNDQYDLLYSTDEQGRLRISAQDTETGEVHTSESLLADHFQYLADKETDFATFAQETLDAKETARPWYERWLGTPSVITENGVEIPFAEYEATVENSIAASQVAAEQLNANAEFIRSGRASTGVMDTFLQDASDNPELAARQQLLSERIAQYQAGSMERAEIEAMQGRSDAERNLFFETSPTAAMRVVKDTALLEDINRLSNGGTLTAAEQNVMRQMRGDLTTTESVRESIGNFLSGLANDPNANGVQKLLFGSIQSAYSRSLSLLSYTGVVDPLLSTQYTQLSQTTGEMIASGIADAALLPLDVLTVPGLGMPVRGIAGAVGGAVVFEAKLAPSFVNDLGAGEARIANAFVRSTEDIVRTELRTGTIAPEAFEARFYDNLYQNISRSDPVLSGSSQGRSVMEALEAEMRAKGITPTQGFADIPRTVISTPDAGSIPTNRSLTIYEPPTVRSPLGIAPRAVDDIAPIAASLPAGALSSPLPTISSPGKSFSQALAGLSASSGNIANNIVQGMRQTLAPIGLSVGILTNPLPALSVTTPVGTISIVSGINTTPASASEASRRGMTSTRQAPLVGQEREVVASFYGNPGDTTAGSSVTSSGAIYDPDGLSIAHRDLRLGTKVLLDDGVHDPIIARVTNRGPFIAGRDVDLSYQAAKHFESTSKGVTRLKMTVLDNPPDSIAYSFSKGRTDFNDGSVVARESAQTLVAQAKAVPNTLPTRVAEAPSVPAENVVVTPDELAARALTADIPPRAPVGTPQLEAINPLNEVDDFFGRIFTPTEQGVKDIVNQVIKQNPYIARTKLAAQVLKEQPSARETSAFKKLRDNVARELAGRRDGQGGVSAAEAARADGEIARQLSVLNGEAQPQRTIGEIAKSSGRPEIPGLEGKVHFLHPLQSADSLPQRVAIIMHQSEGHNAAWNAKAQSVRPNKRGAAIWIEKDGTAYWAVPENSNPSHIRSGSQLRGDNQFIDNSTTRYTLNNGNTIGIEFVGNPPGQLQNPLTPAQMDTAAKLGRFIQERYNIPADRVYAHSWIQLKAESSPRATDRYVEGAAAANVVRMLGYRPGVDALTDFTSISDRALVDTAMANLPSGGPMDPAVRTALRDMGDGVLVAENAPVPDVSSNTFVETAFNRASPFNVLPEETAEQVVRNFTTPSAFDVRPAPVLVSEPAPATRPTTPTSVAANEPQIIPPSATQPREFGVLDAVIETPIWVGDRISDAVTTVADAGSRIRSVFGGSDEAVVRTVEDLAEVPTQGQVIASNELGAPVRSSDAIPASEPPLQEISQVPPAALPASPQPIAMVRVPLAESDIVRPVTPTSVALRPSNRLGDEVMQVSEQPIQIASKTVRVEDIGGADATAVASADVKGGLTRAEEAERKAVAAKVFLTELDTSKRLADNVNRLMSAYFNQGKVLDPQSLSSAIQKSVAQVNRFEKALADAETAGVLDAATAARVRGLYQPVKNTSQLLESQRTQLMRLVPNSHGKVSLGATFGVDGAAEGLQAIRTTPARLRASLAERQALESAARDGAEKTIAAADAARAEAKRIAEAEQLRLVEQEKIAEARATQIVNQVPSGQVAYVPSATPGTWTSADALAAPKGPFEVSIARVSDAPSTPQGPVDLPGQEPGVPSGRTPTIAREEEIDPALNPPPIPRQDPELPFPENTGARPDAEISPTLTTDGGPAASPQTPAVSPYARLRNWVSERVADYRRNRLAAGTGPTQELAPMTDSITQRMSDFNNSAVPRTERADELNAAIEAVQERRDIAIRNATDIRASISDPQVPLPESATDVALTRAAEDMDAAAVRFGESADDLTRAREAFARNTPEGDAEANAFLDSGLKKLEDGRLPESRSLTLVRATEVPAADDLIGRLNQWSATNGGGAGNGGSGTGAAGSAGGQPANNKQSLYQRVTGWWCLQGGWRSGTCAILGISGAGVVANEYQTQTASSDSGETTLGNIPADIPGSIVAVPDTTKEPSAETQPDTRTGAGTDQPNGPGNAPPASDDGSGAGAPRGGGGDRSGTGSDGSRLSESGSGSGFFGGGMNLLSGLLQGLAQWFSGGADDEESQPQQPTPAAPEPPVGAIVGNPQILDAGEATTLSWSTVGTDVSSSTCAIVTADFAVFARGGQNGSISSGALSESTRFGLVCNVKDAQDKLLNETLIRVRGDDTDPPRIFTDEQIAASQASAANPVRPTTQGSNTPSGSSSGGGSSGSPAPQDVRTCDPEQPMDSFIRCLCEAEPNPRGCSIPPGGTR